VPCDCPCEVLAHAEQVLRLAAQGSRILAAAAKRRMHRRLERCGVCGNASIALLQLLGGATPDVTTSASVPRPASWARQHERLGFRSYHLLETDEEYAFAWAASDGFLRRAAQLIRGCSVLHVRGLDAAHAAFVAEVEARIAETGMQSIANVEGIRRPVLIEGRRGDPLGSYWLEAVDLRGRGLFWLAWTDEEDRRWEDVIHRFKALVRQAADIILGLNPDWRLDSYSVPRSRPAPKRRDRKGAR
jgi:hypothetical protein